MIALDGAPLQSQAPDCGVILATEDPQTVAPLPGHKLSAGHRCNPNRGNSWLRMIPAAGLIETIADGKRVTVDK
jgi:hypothetical protein